MNDAGAHSGDFDDALTNTLRPLTDCFLTVRIIKSFTFRTTKNLLLPHVDATTMTVGQLKDLCRERECRAGVASLEFTHPNMIQPPPYTEVKTAPGFKPYRTCELGVWLLLSYPPS